MAWAEKLPSGKYRASYRNAEGKIRSAGTFPRESDAKRAANKKEAEERENPSKKLDPITWGDWEPRWSNARGVQPGTKKADEPKLRKHLRPKWSGWNLADITSHDVQEWVSGMVAPTDAGGLGLAPNTAIKCFMLLSNSLKAAVKADKLASNPCTGVDLPKPGPMPERFLTDPELAAIRNALTVDDKMLFDIFIGTGARLGEGLAVHWESIDLDRKTIRVEWSWDREMRSFKPPKDSQIRDIPIGASLAKRLGEWKQQHPTGHPAPVEYRGSRKPRTGLVVGQMDGRPLDDAGFRARWQAAVRIAYVGSGKNRRHVGAARIHDLRHTYASRLVRAGVPIQEVSRLLGHKDLSTTQRYAHLADSQWDQVRKALG
ncbi:site-specific recombinase XerD [Rhodococcus sp. OK519]|uniref:tyrosine-type recombinase/integrase n=1 Tax=Rhodococcus sp. OK519 TaxID=2135729 RepID=UPI000D395AD9|nr:site-specific recombinase XerD [Rhodococcus sp. OK519]